MEKHGSWTAYEKIGRFRRCVCECGNEATVAISDLRSGKSKSCRKCSDALRRGVSNTAVITHGMEGTTEYRTWTDMRRRCHQPHRPDYKNYGARGIFVCEEWRHTGGGFEAFLRDMGRKPEGHTLERKDNNGPYSPENCIWVTRKVQERNKKSNRFIEVEGVRITIAEASEKYNVPAHRIYSRIHLGWDGDKAVFTKPRLLKRDHSQP